VHALILLETAADDDPKRLILVCRRYPAPRLQACWHRTGAGDVPPASAASSK
jgi:hypothetical protein